jgi:hypothetical protein
VIDFAATAGALTVAGAAAAAALVVAVVLLARVADLFLCAGAWDDATPAARAAAKIAQERRREGKRCRESERSREAKRS